MRINVISAEVADPSPPLEDADSEAASKFTEAVNKLTFGRPSRRRDISEQFATGSVGDLPMYLSKGNAQRIRPLIGFGD